ncbi:MAG TPA: cyclic nucleotide-binding domain-containing protein [Gaiellaceae bacterium]|nr:cyclic nucleotide-binding domain-containing protein [Gaiellaceae bacterium]
MANLADDLKKVPLFSGLSDRELKRLARDFKEREYEAGMTPLREERMSGIGFFVITEGEASVSRDGKELARLGPGDHFGELALISDRVRTATVTAEGRLRTAMLASWEFKEIVRENPEIAWKLLQHVVGLLADAEERGGATGASPPS